MVMYVSNANLGSVLSYVPGKLFSSIFHSFYTFFTHLFPPLRSYIIFRYLTKKGAY